jgi:transposase InsO family protein
VRIGLAMVLADVEQNGADGAVGEAVRAALDPRVRHTDQPMPALARWLRRSAEDSV